MMNGIGEKVWTYHPKESLIGEVRVLVYSGQNAEDEADKHHHEPVGKKRKKRPLVRGSRHLIKIISLIASGKR